MKRSFTIFLDSSDAESKHTVKKNLVEVEELPDLFRNRAGIMWKLVHFHVGGRRSEYSWKK